MCCLQTLYSRQANTPHKSFQPTINWFKLKSINQDHLIFRPIKSNGNECRETGDWRRCSCIAYWSNVMHLNYTLAVVTCYWRNIPSTANSGRAFVHCWKNTPIPCHRLYHCSNRDSVIIRAIGSPRPALSCDQDLFLVRMEIF